MSTFLSALKPLLFGRISFLFLALILPYGVIFAQPTLVKDIVSTPAAFYEPQSLLSVNGILYFSAESGGFGRELWRSDGSKGGTYLVKDITHGVADSSPESMVALNGTLYFIANKQTIYDYTEVGEDTQNTFELWRSDGTLEGTEKVATFPLGYINREGEILPVRLIAADNRLFFTVANEYDTYQLWQSNGTVAGSSKVRDVSIIRELHYESQLIPAGNAVYFTDYVYATNGVITYSVWRSDGTPQGTIQLQTSASVITRLLAVGERVFFNAEAMEGGKGDELWKTDGTKPGTLLVKDLASGPAHSHPEVFFAANSMLYFIAFGDGYQRQLWKSDGTAQGTLLVKSGIGVPLTFSSAVINTIAYFVASSSQSGTEVWRTDGSSSGTYLVKDINPQFDSPDPSYLTHFNGILYFSAFHPSYGVELWKSDGTAQGTVLLKDIAQGGSSSTPAELTPIQGTLYFAASGSLWKSNGTQVGTKLVETDLPASGSPGSNPSNLCAVNGTVFFTVEKEQDLQVWKSNGTGSGTQLVKTFVGNSKQAESLTSLNGQLYFVISGFDTDKWIDQIWKSDGTEQGTLLVKSFSSNNSSPEIGHLTYLNGTLYFTLFFSSIPPASSSQLWKSNGTPEGTVLIKEFTTEKTINASTITNLTGVGSTLFFTAEDSQSGKELWKSNGTPQGTILVKDILPGAEGAEPANLVNWNGTLFFTSSLGLWKSNGTSSGTVLVSNPGGSPALGMILGGKQLYLLIYNRTQGYQVWKSNGTSPGTVLVKQFDNTISLRGGLQFANNTLYFRAHKDDFSGKLIGQLWKSNGTATSTLLLKEIDVNALYAVGNTLVFSSQNRLWRSKGTAQTTTLVSDLLTDLRSVAVINSRIYFSGDDGRTGYELWKYDTETCSELTNKNLTPQGSSVCIGENGTITLQSTQTGIFYQAYINGSPVGSQLQGGGTITLPVPAVSLSEGANTFTIKASGCVLTDLTNKAIVTVMECATACSATGSILQELWLSVAGSLVTDIPLNTSPNSTKPLTSFEAPNNAGTNYGQRIRGYLCVPASGSYTFYIAGDDRAELYVSTDENPSKKVKIASVPYYTGVREWSKYPAQKSAPIALTAGKKYYIEALHKEGSYSDHLAVGWQVSSTAAITVIPGSVLSPFVIENTGRISRELWTNVPGSAVSDIPLSTPPSTMGTLPSFEAPSNAGNNYGQRIQGYLHPQVSGSHTFFIAGDDRCELWISLDEDPANKYQIAYVPYFTASRQWNKYSRQQSITLYLVAGKKYYIEALHKEGLYGDNLAVGWTLPGQTTISVISGSFLSPYLPASSIARAGVDEVLKLLTVQVFPNPFTSTLTLATSYKGTFYISLTDNLGRTLYQTTKQANGSPSELDLPALPAGVYVVKVSAEDGKTKVMRVVKK